MKIHKHLVEQIISSLKEIFPKENSLDSRTKYADKVIEKYLKKHPKWGSRDRRFFAESVYEIVRWKRLLEYLSDDTSEWGLWSTLWLRQGNELPDWSEIPKLQKQKIREREKNISEVAIRESIPDWMNTLGEKEFKDRWPRLIHALNQPSDVFLRVNTLKATRSQVQESLLKDNVEAQWVNASLPDCLQLKERKNVFITKAFKDGFFEVQDAGSQMIAPLLNVQPGDRIIDACAGAGGKSLHMAALMKNKGKIIAMDIHEWKLKELKQRARRDGVDIIETKVIDSTKTIKRLYDSADKVLLDVPCSGMGVLRRNPDTKWKLSMEEILRLTCLQEQILKDYSLMVKSRGFLVYSTCSILSIENQNQVQKFLSQTPQWKLIKEMHIYPDSEGFDGFYAALLQRL